MTIGLSKEYLCNSLESVNAAPIDESTKMAFSMLLEKLIEECYELNPWLPIDENTPKDREVLLYYPNMLRSNSKVIGYAFERNVSPMHGNPTHYQELPDNPKE